MRNAVPLGIKSNFVPLRTDSSARALVWAAWLVLLLIALLQLRIYDNIPITEDWQVVPALTGHEPNITSWLWEQNNEHRVPMPKVILLLLLKAGGGDFRIGMLANIALLAAASALLISTARTARGGRSSFSDAFFPVALMNLGNWENLFWAWQITFVLSVVPVCVILVLLVRPKGLLSPIPATLAGICLVILPLCGGTGLLFVPLLAIWAAVLGVRAIRAGKSLRRTGVILISSVTLSACITLAYFVGYVRPSWTGPRASLGQALVAATRFMSFGFGPVVTASWTLFIIMDGLLLGAAAICLVTRIGRVRGPERLHALGLLVYFLTTLFYAAAFGYGRGHVIADVYGAWPTRYVLLAVPQLCVIYFIWQLYAPARLQKYLIVLLVVALAVLPLNVALGIRSSTWYVSGKQAVMADLARGVSSYDLARQQGQFLAHSTSPENLAASIRMLRDAGIRPFQLIRESPFASQTPSDPQWKSHEIHYQLDGASEVYLVWGINGWRSASGSSTIMHTPMIRNGNTFEATIRIPPGARLDCGFLITELSDAIIPKPIWEDGLEHADVSKDPTIDIRSKLAIDEDGAADYLESGGLIAKRIRYHLPSAARVDLIWGVKEWYAVPRTSRPPSTTIRNGLMVTPMTRVGNIFTVDVAVPTGGSINYGFLILGTRGLLDLPEPVWDGSPDYRASATGDETIEVTSRADLFEWTRFVPRLSIWVAILGLMLVIWVALFLVLELRRSTRVNGYCT